jgi:hypothetical protein
VLKKSNPGSRLGHRDPSHLRAGTVLVRPLIFIFTVFLEPPAPSNNSMNPGIAIFTLLASQLIGYSFAGILQEALVYPSITFWPTTIVPANMFQALHFDGGLSSKRTKLFWTVFTAIFVWEIFPQWIFPLLTGVSIFCLVSLSLTQVRESFLMSDV